MTSITISVDISGGDHGHTATMPAVLNFLQKNQAAKVVAVGDQTEISPYLKNISASIMSRIEIVHAEQKVTMDEEPIKALRFKKQSSMRRSIDLMANKKADICVSAGNTGALMAMSHFVLKPIEGVERPAIMGSFPTKNGKEVSVLDLGANVTASAENLYQFGLISSMMMRAVKGFAPKVGLLNVGHEDIKGTAAIKEAASKMQDCEHINYIGYIEGDEVFENVADIILCDGFVGNVMLKSCEGLVQTIVHQIKNSFKRRPIFAVITQKIFKAILKEALVDYDVDHRNGALFIGLNNLVVKTHGKASSTAYTSALELAYNTALNLQGVDYYSKIKSILAAERSA
jgi:phosphate acyltransferase|tara:strand:- start:394 stop:1425 length:1032 start_codon:yes stop_codon:yes gene_type:complete